MHESRLLHCTRKQIDETNLLGGKKYQNLNAMLRASNV